MADVPMLVDSSDALKLSALLGELNGSQILPAREVLRISELLRDLSILSEIQSEESGDTLSAGSSGNSHSPQPA